jgi:phage terminase small subunit
MLTKKQKKFADEYIETGNGKKSALIAYDTNSDSVAEVIASQNLRKLKIQEYLESKAEIASSRIVELMKQDDNLGVALNSAKDILDRAGFKPVDKKDLTTNGESLNKILVEFIDGDSTKNTNSD